MKRRVTVFAGLVLSIALLWWALRDVAPGELWLHLRSANPWLLILSVVLATGTFLLRAFRWRVLLLPAHPHSHLPARFKSVCIGFMANNLLPLRLGEFARAYSLSRIEPVQMSAALASLVVERLFDGLVLTLFLLPGLWSVRLAGGEDPGIIWHLALVASVSVAFGLVALWLLVSWPARVLGFVTGRLGRFLPHTAIRRVSSMMESFVAGLGAIKHPMLFARVLAWSGLVWLWNAASFWVGFLAFGIGEPGVRGALFLQTFIGFAVSIPSSPGFFGPFEAASRLALSAYDVGPARIISFAAGYHILTFIPVTVLGLWFTHRLGISWSEVEHSEEFAEAAVGYPEAAESP
ncbi:MAG: lysylphosphatidylglycerol synthase transmembrane domain-containing protein [Gemmatimonadota bacterium]